MTLAKALKKKNRLTQKIAQLQHEIQRENSARSDDPRKLKVEDLMSSLNETVEALIKIKLAIFVASTPMRESILRLSELKSKIAFIHGITTREGKVSDYGDEPIEYTVVYDKLWVRDNIEKIEQEIDNIQEELDKFNHTTNIDV